MEVLHTTQQFKKIFASLAMVLVVSSPLSGFVPTAYAAINPQINYQGKLTTPANVAVTDGSYDIEFNLYTAATGGSPIWTETRVVTITSGLFSVMLGASSTLTSVNFNQPLYLGVTIEADDEMEPRKILGAVPAAFESERLDGLDSTQFVRTDAASTIATSSATTLLTVTQNGVGNILDLFDGVTNVFSVLDGGNVGIGTTTPGQKLSVAGNMRLTGALFDTNNASGTTGMVLQTTGTGTRWVATSTLGLLSTALTSLNGQTGATQTFATGTATGIGLTIVSSGNTHTFTPTVSSGYSIPLTASTTQWAASYASSTALTPAYMRGLFSNSATGLTYNSSTGATSLTAGYVIPLSASTTEWTNFYNTPSTRITAGTALSWNGNTISVSTSTLASTFATGTNMWDGSLGGNIYSLNSGNVGIGTTTPSSKLEVNGNITLTSGGGQKITTPGNNLILEQTGDSFGTSRLSLQNRSGSAGALFENTGLDLVDFGFKGSTGYQSNLRYEHRSAEILGGSDTSIGEFQFIDNATNLSSDVVFLTTNKSATIIHTGNFGIGSTTPGSKLTVVGDAYIGGNVTATGTLSVAGNTTLANASSTNFSVSGNSYLGTVLGGIWNGSTIGVQYGGTGATSLTGLLLGNGTSAFTATTTLAQGYGGTGIASYTAGDLLYANSTGNLTKLPIGSSGEVLKVAAGLPTWGIDQTVGAGGGDGVWATSTGFIYPQDTATTIVIGDNATSTTNSIFEVVGNSYFSNNVGIGDTSPTALLTVGAGDAFQVTSLGVIASGTWNGTDIDVSDYTNLGVTATGLELSGDNIALTSGYSIPLTASTTEWSLAYASSTALTPAYMRGLFSNSATGLTYNSSTGATSLTAGYNIPLTASTTNWSTFFDTPSTRITAGTGLSWTGNTLNASLASLNYWHLVSGGLETASSTDFARAAYFVATSTTATSTFAGNLAVSGNATISGVFRANFGDNSDGHGIGELGINYLSGGNPVLYSIGGDTITVSSNLHLNGGDLYAPSTDNSSLIIGHNRVARSITFQVATSTTNVGETALTIGGNGDVVVNYRNFGIGSSTPGSKLTVIGDAYIGGNVTATGTLALSGLATLSSGVLVNGDTITDFTGTGLTISGGALTVSTSSLANLDADTLDGQDGSYYLSRTNHTGTQGTSTISNFDSSVRALVSSAATGLTYTNSTGVFSLTAGYNIPLTASTTNWASFFDTPSTRITAGTGLSWTGNTLNASLSGLNYWRLVSGGLETASSTDFARAAYFVATSTTATSTFAGALTVGTNRLVVNTNGNVGVGTTNPTGKLEIYSGTSGGTANPLIDDIVVQGNDDVGISLLTPNSEYARYGFGDPQDSFIAGLEYSHQTDKLTIITNNVDAIVIASSSNVGIGVALPGAKLDIAADNDAATYALRLVDENTLSDRFHIQSRGTGNDALLDMFVSGNIGIGSTTPGSKLTVIGDAYIGGNVTATGTLSVAGNTTLANASTTNLTNSGNAYLGTVLGGIWNGSDIDVSDYTNLGVTATGLELSGDNIALTSGYSIPLTASTTEWSLAYASSTALTPAYMRGLFSNTATGLTYDSATGATSLTSGYTIPLTASTTNWAAFFDTPSTRITAGTGLSWTGNTLNASLASLNYWRLVSGGLETASSTDFARAAYFVATSTTATSTFAGTLTVGSDRLVVNTNGNVGVGTTTPSEKLDIQGNLRLTTSSGNRDFVIEAQGSGGTTIRNSGYLNIQGGVTSGVTLAYNGGTEGFRLAHGGNVGIGTDSSPDYKLDVQGTFHADGLSSFDSSVGIGTTTPDTALSVVGVITATGGNSTAWNLAYASTTALTPAYLRGLFSNTATGLTYDSATGATSLTAGYNIPLTASTTDWATFFDTPSTRITAGTGLSWTGNTLNASLASLNYWRLVSGGLETASSTDFARAAYFVATSTTATSTFAGAVGIKTTSPLYTFDIWDTAETSVHIGASNGRGLLLGGPSNTVVGVLDIRGGGVSSRYLDFRSEGNSAMVLTIGGNLGIGTTTPGSKFTLVGNAYIGGSATTTGAFSVAGQTTLANASTTNLTVSGNSYLGTILSGTWNGTDIDVSDYTNLGVTATGLELSGDNIALSSGYSIPLTASTTNWNLAYASTTALTPTYIRGLFSNSATGLTYDSATGATSLTAGYTIPLTASTTNWASFFDTPSTRITAGTALSWSGNTLNVSTSTLASTFATGTNMWGGSLGGNIYALNSGSVGIGTTSPAGKLHVIDSSFTAIGVEESTTRNFATMFAGTVNPGISWSVGDDLRIGTAANINGGSFAESMRITSTGNVGIGTTSPSAKLHLTNTGSGASFLVEDSTSPDTTPFIVDASGNVGIGTSTPAQTLSIAGNMRLTGALFDMANASGTQGMVLSSTGTGTSWVATSTLGFLTASSIDTSAELAAILGDETGTAGSVVFSTGPTFTGNTTLANASTTNLTNSGNAYLGTILSGTWNGTDIDVSDYINLAVSATGLSLSGDSIALTAGYSIPLTASTTNWNLAYASTTALTPSYIRNLFSNSATGLTYDSATGATSLTSGYTIPLTASTTNWATFFDTPSTRITAGTGLSWTGNTLSASLSSLNYWRLVSGGLETASSTDFARAAYFVATSTTATSTFAGGFAVDTSGLVYNLHTNRVGIGTQNPAYSLDITGNINSTAGKFRADAGNVYLDTILEYTTNNGILIYSAYNSANPTVAFGGAQDASTVRVNTNVKNLASSNNDAWDLGGSSLRWRTLYAVDIDATGTSTLATTTASALTASSLTLGSALTVANGGTGATSLTGLLLGNGTSAFTATSTLSSSYLDSSVILSSEIDTCSELAAILSGATTGTCGSFVLSAGPTFTGNTTLANASTTNLTVSGASYFNTISATGQTTLANASSTNFGVSGNAYFAGGIWSSAGNVGIGTTTLGARLSVQSTSTSDILNLFETGGTEVFTVLENGNVGIGSSTPSSLLTVAGNGFFTGSLTASNFVAASSTATSTFAGGLNVGNGAIVYDYSSGVTSISNLQLGALSFEADAGILSWVDMPVTSASATGTAMSYSAQLDGNPLLTIYGESDGLGGIQNYGVGIGTTTPSAKFAVTATAGSGDLFALASSSNARLLTVNSLGYLGLGTSTPAQILSVAGNMRLTGALFDTLNASGTTGMILSSTGTSTQWISTSSLAYISSLNGMTGNTQTFATGTATGIGLNIVSSGNIHTFTPTVSSGYSIPLTASTTNWASFFDTPSTRITAGTGLSWTGNTLNASLASLNYWRLVSGGLETASSTDFARAAYFVATSTTATSTFAGWVGIGTTTMSNALTVAGSVTINQGAVTNKPSLVITNLGAGTTGIDIGSLSIGDNSGSVITADDVANLSLSYSVRGGGGGSAYGAHAFTTDSSASGAFDAVMLIRGGGAGARLLSLQQSDATEVFTVTYDGNVGIGSSTPGSKLTVNGTTHLGGNVTATGTLSVAGNTTLANASTTNLTNSGNAYLGTILSGNWNGADIDISGYTNLAVSATGLSLSGDSVALAAGYSIPLTASTTNWNLAYASTTALTPSYIRGLFSGTSPVAYNSSTGVFSITADSIGDTELAFNTGQHLTTTSNPTFANLTLTNASTTNLTVSGNTYLTGTLYDSLASAGTLGMVLQTTGAGAKWVATSTLGISGGAATFLSLTDTPSSYTAGSILFTSGSAVTEDNAQFYWDNASKRLAIGHNSFTGLPSGTDLAVISTTTATARLTVANTNGTDVIGIFDARNDGTAQVQFGSTSAHPLAFFTSGTEYMTLDASGNLGIGTTTPNTRLTVFNTSADAQVRISYDSTRFATMQVNSTGDLLMHSYGGDTFWTDDNLWVCAAGACPTVTASSTGNVIAEGGYYFGNGMKIDQVVGTTTEIAVYNASGTAIIIFDH